MKVSRGVCRCSRGLRASPCVGKMEEQERYIEERVDPLIRDLVHAVLTAMPSKPLDFMTDWWLTAQARRRKNYCI